MLDDIKFRVASLNDIDHLCIIRKKQLIDEGIIPCINIDTELQEFFQECFQKDMIYEILACLDDRIIATGAVCFYSYPPTYTNQSGKIAYITNMYTDPNYRKQGIASQILQMLEQEVKRRQVEVMRLGASSLGKPVYKNFGFKYDDHVWMSKRIEVNDDENKKNEK